MPGVFTQQQGDPFVWRSTVSWKGEQARSLALGEDFGFYKWMRWEATWKVFKNKRDMIWLHFLIELLWLLCGKCTTEGQVWVQGDQLGSLTGIQEKMVVA